MKLWLVIGLTARLGAETDLRSLADKAPRHGPWTVTAGRPAVRIPVNDYYSEAPYWWPDPQDATVPYIRRDGETNADRFQAHRQALGKMSQAIVTLGMAAERWPKGGYAERGGQAVRGRNTGRGAGIIDTRDFIRAVEGIRLLEKGSENNHANWWSAQVAAYARYAGDESMRRMVYGQFRNALVSKQIETDGSAPREESRTRSLSYSAFSLHALLVVCCYAGLDGDNLLDASNFPAARRYLTPFVLHPSTWKKQQIVPVVGADHFFPWLAGDNVSYAELPPATDVRRLFWERMVLDGAREIRKR